MDNENQPVQEENKETSVNQRVRQEALETLHGILHRAIISGELPSHEAILALKALEEYGKAVEELMLGLHEVMYSFSKVFDDIRSSLFEMSLTQKSVEKVLMDKNIVTLEELETTAAELYKNYREQVAAETEKKEDNTVDNELDDVVN